ncbi:hypothetical protein AADZ90_001330 [Aestuariibius sp. 2305UL40-4]|uniref:hypothetical protein n=1 Tax=Aestuariibius violaceus TaxID=3234132 RepID=UPI00345E242A
MGSVLITERRGAVLHLRLNRAKRQDALNVLPLGANAEELTSAADNPEVPPAAVVVSGGRRLIARAVPDTHALQPQDRNAARGIADRALAAPHIGAGQRTALALEALPKEV